ncbi:ABC transporter substrate-binding protein [Spongiactinospora rosea]|uniref:ABC transporter substrate-binding protein n=1 Tax=Spongiactinospora rosea TaxID=2248750 RepID=A0A366LRR6_9ACTN|nr:ABC transporter substrate-binding protein [Spongiactinospora rosea]RBQ16310.1 ABC transporter substrate-binding protein [Spongiactinospora rosea]
MRRPPLIVPLAALALLAAACGGADASGGAGQVVIRMSDPGNSGFLAVAKRDGTLDAALAKVNAKVKWAGDFSVFAPAAQAINAGSLDIATGSITAGVTALAVKPSFKIFATVPPDLAGEGIVVKKDSPIRSVADLAGRSVAVGHGGTSEYLLLKALRTFDVPVEKVKRVYLPPPQTAPVFGSGEVDSWSTFSTFLIPAVTDLNARILADGAAIKSDNYVIYVAANKLLDEHPEVVKALFEFIRAGSAKEIADPAAYQNVFTKAGPQAVQGAQQDLVVGIRKKGRPVQAVTPAEIAKYQEVAKFFLEQKVLTAPLDVSRHVVTGIGGGER